MSPDALVAALSPRRPLILGEVESVVFAASFAEMSPLLGEFLSVDEFACTDRSCAPPPVGTGGSRPSGGARTGDKIIPKFKATSRDDLELLFPNLTAKNSNKVQYADGTMSVEGLNEDGSFKTFSPETEKKTEKVWESIGVPKEKLVANLVAAGRMAMGIDLITGEIDKALAEKGKKNSKWYSDAHNQTLEVAKKNGLEHLVVAAAATVLSAGRLWSGTKNGNIETVANLADIVTNPRNIIIEQKHIDLMRWRRQKSTKGVGKTGLPPDLEAGEISTNDLDTPTLVEVLYAINTLRGHPSFDDWAVKSTKDGKIGGQSTKENDKTDPIFPFFTNKGTQQVKQAVAILRGEVTPREGIAGPKYSSFVSNIMNPNRDYSSTNDTWHYRVMAGNLMLTKFKEEGPKGAKRSVPYTRTLKEHSLKKFSPDGKINTAQDIFQSGPQSVDEGLEAPDTMFRDTTKITREALDILKRENPEQFGDMKLHEFQALIWVHYGGGEVGQETRTDLWFGALDKMSQAGL